MSGVHSPTRNYWNRTLSRLCSEEKSSIFYRKSYYKQYWKQAHHIMFTIFFLANSREKLISRIFCGKASTTSPLFYYRLAFIISIHITYTLYRKTYVLWKFCSCSQTVKLYTRCITALKKIVCPNSIKGVNYCTKIQQK